MYKRPHVFVTTKWASKRFIQDIWVLLLYLQNSESVA